MSKYLLILFLFLFFMPFFFLELSCVTSFFFLFFSRLPFFFLLWLRCSSFFDAGHFPFSFWGRAEFVLRVFGLFFLVSYFLGPCVFSLSLDRPNQPLRNRFLLVLSLFFWSSSWNHGNPIENHIKKRYAQVLAPNMSMLRSHIHEYGHVRNRHCNVHLLQNI